MAAGPRVSYARLSRDATMRQVEALERIADALEYFMGVQKMEHPEMLKAEEPDPTPTPEPEPEPGEDKPNG